MPLVVSAPRGVAAAFTDASRALMIDLQEDEDGGEGEEDEDGGEGGSGDHAMGSAGGSEERMDEDGE